MTSEQATIDALSTLFQIEKVAREAVDLAEVGFIAVNKTLELVPYRQAVLWRKNGRRGLQVHAVSGVDQPDPNAPFVLFVKRLIRSIAARPEGSRIHTLLSADMDAALRPEWETWKMGTALYCPLFSPRGEVLGGLLFTREQPWEQKEAFLLERAVEVYGYAWWALRGGARPLYGGIRRFFRNGLVKLAAAAALVALASLPVRFSALAPAEIVPVAPLVVSSAIEGVIREILVEPNQPIARGDLLFRMDDTVFRNKFEVSTKALAVARANYMRARQKSFSDEKSRSELLLLEARIDQQKAEVAYMAEVLDKTEVRAGKSGIVIFEDVDEWIGKPVTVGERIMRIADEASVEAEIQLPVKNAIHLEKGAPVRVFLNMAPGDPLNAVLRKASYEARLDPTGTLAFRLKAALADNAGVPRIGLRGTAKIYGEQVSLFYYIMRRPLAALRQAVGI